MIYNRDDLFKLVCNIRTPINLNEEDWGTGFFIFKDNKYYLVTASHVSIENNINSYCVITDQLGKVIQFKLQELNKKLNWKHHNIADISILEIEIQNTSKLLTKSFFENHSIDFSHFHIQKNSPSRDIQLTSIGFPALPYIKEYLSPLSYRSYAASGFIEMPRFDNKIMCKFFCLENPSMGGYSGCPILDLGYVISGSVMTTNDMTRCYGIMHGVIGNMSVVTPAFYLAELLNNIAPNYGFSYNTNYGFLGKLNLIKYKKNGS